MTDAIAAGDARALTRALALVDSRNPSLVDGGPGELAAATLLRHVLDEWGFRTAMHEAAPGRPNLVARIGGGDATKRSVMFNGHLDVVGVEGMTHAPFDAGVRDGRMYGRGTADMKGGIAAMPPFMSAVPRPYIRPSRTSASNGAWVIPSTPTTSR